MISVAVKLRHCMGREEHPVAGGPTWMSRWKVTALSVATRWSMVGGSHGIGGFFSLSLALSEKWRI